MPLGMGSFLSEKEKLTPQLVAALEVPYPLYKMAAKHHGAGRTNTGFTQHCCAIRSSPSPAAGARSGASALPWDCRSPGRDWVLCYCYPSPVACCAIAS